MEAHLKLTWQFEQIHISLRWTVLREFQDGGRISKLRIQSEALVDLGRSIDWYHFRPLLNLARQSL
jgi:hypothetical protein